MAILLAAVGIAGCSKPAPPTIVPEQATMTSLDMLAVHLEVALTATNPNAVDLPLRDVTARIVIAQRYDLGTATIPNAVTLPAGKATKLDVPVSVGWSDMGALAQLAATSAAVPFTVDGTVDLGGDLIAVSMPFHIAGVVSHEQLVGAALNSLPGIMPGTGRPRRQCEVPGQPRSSRLTDRQACIPSPGPAILRPCGR